MYRVKLNRERLKNHIQYDWWKYILCIIATIAIWNVVTTVTKPKTPADKKIEIFLIGDYMFDEPAAAVSEGILDDFPNLWEVNINNISLGGEDLQMDYMGRQKLMVMLASQTGDIYAFEKDEFAQIAEQGAFISLDEFVEENGDLIGEDRLGKSKKMILEEDVEPHYYGISMNGLELFMDTGYDVSDKVIGIMGYSDNPSMAVEVLKWILNDGVKKD
ncbi:MAG TPA: hypothetical protein VFD89_06540 [Clostridia bacterium]|nr:hypothetical protein [Clostridia bacterium]